MQAYFSVFLNCALIRCCATCESFHYYCHNSDENRSSFCDPFCKNGPQKMTHQPQGGSMGFKGVSPLAPQFLASLVRVGQNRYRAYSPRCAALK